MGFNTLRRLALAGLLFSFLQVGYGQDFDTRMNRILRNSAKIHHNISLEILYNALSDSIKSKFNTEIIEFFIAEQDALFTLPGNAEPIVMVYMYICNRNGEPTLCPCSMFQDISLETSLSSIQNEGQGITILTTPAPPLFGDRNQVRDDSSSYLDTISLDSSQVEYYDSLLRNIDKTYLFISPKSLKISFINLENNSNIPTRRQKTSLDGRKYTKTFIQESDLPEEFHIEFKVKRRLRKIIGGFKKYTLQGYSGESGGFAISDHSRLGFDSNGAQEN